MSIVLHLFVSIVLLAPALAHAEVVSRLIREVTFERVAESDNIRGRRHCLRQADEEHRREVRLCRERTAPQYDACHVTDFACTSFWLKKRDECWESVDNMRREWRLACHNHYPREND